jgi:hypothetical protein
LPAIKELTECFNLISIAYVVVSAIALCIFGFVAIRPQGVRQERADKKFYERELLLYAERHRDRMKQEVKDYLTKGIPDKKDYDPKVAKEEELIAFQSKKEFDAEVDSGRIKAPPVRMTDPRWIVIGTSITVGLVLLQALLPIPLLFATC